MENNEAASLYFSEGYNCAQSVVMEFAEQFGMTPELAAKMAASFGGGIARTGRVCGAVTGALMVIGLYAGSSDPTDKAAKERSYALANQFISEFTARFGALDCPSLLDGYHLGIPEEAARARELGLTNKRCPEYVRNAARMLGSIIK